MKGLGENTETYKTFSVEFEKTNSEKPISYKLKFIDTYRFINRSLDTLVNNLSELNNNTCNKYKERTKSTHYCEFVKTHENRLMYKCLNCRNTSLKPLTELINKFQNTYKLCNNDHEKFILLLRKGIYPYEYIDNWNEFDETLLPSKEEFYSNLNMSNISDKNMIMQIKFGTHLILKS